MIASSALHSARVGQGWRIRQQLVENGWILDIHVRHPLEQIAKVDEYVESILLGRLHYAVDQ